VGSAAKVIVPAEARTVWAGEFHRRRGTARSRADRSDEDNQRGTLRWSHSVELVSRVVMPSARLGGTAAEAD